ncbi:heterokaryon incompatibility protein-domain-containing protein [Astrocystis sublimbata]|nr:heterokaryon incompatibility protein-domain-containing protein [Astrocystis sublimbata]
MWLINCQTLTLVEKGSPARVKYAILSHTWEEGEEVQFYEFKHHTATEKRGWAKIRNLCRLALADGYQFAWCDTCCIDKTSSAELTEAINSMFPWYAAADICYVYLADYDSSNRSGNMGDSRWFKRGWTLQELIAPAEVRFYDSSWSTMGTKVNMSKEIAEITGIEENVLSASKDRDLDDVLGQLSIAKRMAWAAKRETTRTEDAAYCLLGIFGVNLPLLYGEGDRAFMRLQEEIVKTSNDLSLFAWTSSENALLGSRDSYSGVFAQNPRDFLHSGEMVLSSNGMYNSEFTLCNKGIKMEMLLFYSLKMELHLLALNCHEAAAPKDNIGIYLKHHGANVYSRARPRTFVYEFDANLKMSPDKSFFLNKQLTPALRDHWTQFTAMQSSSQTWEEPSGNFSLMGRWGPKPSGMAGSACSLQRDLSIS